MIGKHTQLLVIDEMSMLTAAMLAKIDRVLKNVYETHSPYGGLNVLLVGDFFQLPPVQATDPLHKAIVHRTCNQGGLAHDTIFGVDLFSRFQLFQFTTQERSKDPSQIALISALRDTSSIRPITLKLLNNISRQIDEHFIQQKTLLIFPIIQCPSLITRPI